MRGQARRACARSRPSTAARGLGQTRRQRARIVRIADSLGLALVAGSDNHGCRPARMDVFRVPGWRNAAPVQLAEELERQIRDGGRAATRVAERRVADPATACSPLAAPIAFWRMLTTLSLGSA